MVQTGVDAEPPLSAEERLERFAAQHQLTPRERDIAGMAAHGEGNKGIAFKLGISPVTVNVHLGKVYRKTGVTNRTELAGLLARS